MQNKSSIKLNKQLQEIKKYIPKHEVVNPSVSSSTIGWHIDHSLKVINSVVKTLHASDPETYKDNFSILGKFFLAIGYFPRGRAKAPKYVRPPEQILEDDLISQIETARTNLETIKQLHNNSYFKHPMFGNINTQRVNRFLVTHTKHHLKIIRDILKK